jgi:hypothetical protein
MLVNTAGHSNIVFDFAALFKTTTRELDNGPRPVACMATFADHIYSVFAYKNKLVAFKNTEFAAEIDIDVTSDDVEVLQMIPNQKHLTILTK